MKSTDHVTSPSLLWYLPAAAWAAFLLYLGSRSFDVPFTQGPIPWDKIAHLGLYGGLGALAVMGWRLAGRRPHIAVPLTLALAVGLADEIRQRRVPLRSADPLDFLADLVAIVLAFAILGRRPKDEGVE